MAKREALGSGLEELFGEMNAVYEKSVATNTKQIYEIQIASISPNPKQPRKVFDTKSLDELAQSIEKHGLLQPIIVRQGEKNGYMLVAGERRYRAMKLLGYKTIPAIIIDAKQHKMRELALIENIQRENLNPIELALCYQALIIEHNLTQEELSRIIQKSRTQLTNTLRLLELSKTAQELIKEEKITQGHAKVLIGLNEEDEKMVLQSIVTQKLNVRDTENLVKKIKAKNQPNCMKSNHKNIATEILDIDDSMLELKKLLESYAVRVTVKNHMLHISFGNKEHIQELIAKLQQ